MHGRGYRQGQGRGFTVSKGRTRDRIPVQQTALGLCGGGGGGACHETTTTANSPHQPKQVGRFHVIHIHTMGRPVWACAMLPPSAGLH